MTTVLRLESPAFRPGAAIPRRYTCDGENVSPALEWSGAPEGALSFAILCDDPDAPGGVWRHWAVYDLPPTLRRLPEGAGAEGVSRQAVNDFGHPGYGGPCPPRGHGAHRYRFRLLALSTDILHVPSTASCRMVEQEARKHLLAEAVLEGVYGR
ncbi:YbhB/YbcL family Raf kinase inhibitor-like protein [Alsobacter soli]|uniref:YbhB/YbcL family Raf kinase inhibitor-like protein n=1 Tax=Alsobacter soli TaxID=2109933 RepID=UPI001FDF9E0F|nr:YbhB/YbcL family Raf kinase inhibitor-like protein [Alsobacter soli]